MAAHGSISYTHTRTHTQASKTDFVVCVRVCVFSIMRYDRTDHLEMHFADTDDFTRKSLVGSEAEGIYQDNMMFQWGADSFLNTFRCSNINVVFYKSNLQT